MDEQRGQWSSKYGFILAAAGSAIGLGNIWRFPYLVGENGGAAFLLIYIFFVIVIGLPYMMAELSLGRSSNLNPVGAIKKLKNNKSLWWLVGLFGVITGVGILSFYAVISGWTVGYIFKTFFGQANDFSNFVSDPFIVIILLAIFLGINALIIYGGVEGGIEKWSKILMPVLFILMFLLIIYSNNLDGAYKGLEFFLVPDFSKITGYIILAALGQAFFSLSLGMGLIVTYGSYLSKKEDIFSGAFFVTFFDTLIAIMAGFIIFPALFAMGENPSEGVALTFIVLPKLFAKMPFGNIVGAIFFILLSIAALTSTISLLEVPVSYLVDEKKISRKKLVFPVSFVVFLLAIPPALSQGASEFFTNFGLIPGNLASPDFLSQMSFFWGDFSLAFGAFLMSIFIGWVWGAKNAADEIDINSKQFRKIRKVWVFMIKYFIPIIIFIILLNVFKIFD